MRRGTPIRCRQDIVLQFIQSVLVQELIDVQQHCMKLVGECRLQIAIPE
jgi:hypothetical protein